MPAAKKTAAAAKTAETTKAAETFESLTTVNADAFKDGYEKISKGMTDFADFQKGAFEAVMSSASAFAKGVEKVAAENTAFGKAALEESVAAAKEAATAKSVQEALDANAAFVRASVEKNLGQFNKVTDLWMETTKEAAEPLTARYNEFVELVQSYRP
ncbi:MAG: phasin family protein [Parvularculaceae bacterium]